MSPADAAGLVSFLIGVAVGWAMRGGPRPLVRVRIGAVEISAENEYTVAALLDKARETMTIKADGVRVAALVPRKDACAGSSPAIGSTSTPRGQRPVGPCSADSSVGIRGAAPVSPKFGTNWAQPAMAATTSIDASLVLVVGRDEHDAMCAHGASVSVDTPAGMFAGCTAESAGQDPDGRWRVRLDLNPSDNPGRSDALLKLRGLIFGGGGPC